MPYKLIFDPIFLNYQLFRCIDRSNLWLVSKKKYVPKWSLSFLLAEKLSSALQLKSFLN